MMAHNSRFHEFPKPLKFDQYVNTIYFDDRARIRHLQKKDLRGASCREMSDAKNTYFFYLLALWDPEEFSRL